MRNKKQRYRCNECNYIFSIKLGRKSDISKKLWTKYADKNQTYKDLATEFNTSINSIKRKLEKYKVETKKKKIQENKIWL